MKIFVTGGAGFIGRHLIESLNHGNEVTLFENFSNSSKQEISYLLQDGVTLVQGDLTDLALLKKVVRDYDLVIHLAAKIDIKESIKNPHLSNEINVNGTINLLKACVVCRPAWRRYGPARTPASRSGTRWHARRSTRPPVPV